jgi:hypothetical protein
MSESTEQVLEQAFALIENDQQLEAAALLKPVLAEEPDNVDAWWLYAHAVDDPETARMALNMVQKLDPEYPGADELLTSLESEYPVTALDKPAVVSEPEIRRVAPPPTLPNLPEDDEIDDFDELIFDETTDEPDFAETTTEVPVAEVKETRRSNNWVIPALALVAILAVVLILVAILSRGGGEQVTPNQTSVAQVATLPVDDTQLTTQPTDVTEAGATADASSLDVGAVPTNAVSSDTETAVTAALADFEVVADSIGATPTLLGNTLVTSVCSSSDGRERSDALNQIMYTLADTSTLMDSDIEAVGVRLVNCDNERVYNVIAVPVSDAIAFSEGELDERAYQATWRPVL